MCNCDWGFTHSLIRIRTGEGTLGDELQTLPGIIHPSELVFSPSWNSFPLAAPDSAETLAWTIASTLFVPKVQLSLLELFRRFLSQDQGSLCQQQATRLLSGSARRIDLRDCTSGGLESGLLSSAGWLYPLNWIVDEKCRCWKEWHNVVQFTVQKVR